MAELRQVDLPEKDRPLREDVSLLGSIVGEMLVDQHGQSLLDAVERVRKAAILSREGDDGCTAQLDAALRDLDDDDIMRMIHAFSTYLRVVNLAEKVHRIRRRRVYQRDRAQPQPGSLEAVIGDLQAQGFSAQEIGSQIARLEILPVFTAHPTEATRRTILEKEYDLVLRLVERLNPELTPGEEHLALERIRAAITSSWQTRIEPHSRTTVADEHESILFYMTETLYRVVPGFYEALEQALTKQFGNDAPELNAREMLRFGSWVGGDMDGNPFVTADTFLDTLARQRRIITGRYCSEVRRLARYLSQSLSEVSVSDAVLERLADYQSRMPKTDDRIPERDRDMPYRCLLRFVEARLAASLEGNDSGYEALQAFIGDLELIRDSLASNRGRFAGQFGVERLLRRVRTFGFHLAALDLRQDALLHRRVMGELLGDDEWMSRPAVDRVESLARRIEEEHWPVPPEALSDEARSTLAVFRAMNTAQQEFGIQAVGVFIISMAQDADDVLTVLALDAIANREASSRTHLPIAPLLETVDDLDAGPAIFDRLLDLRVYRRHLESFDQRQMIMLGYSDSSKDSGIVASRWALHEAQRDLVERGRQADIQVCFFHGRGGTVSRGGGNLVNGILGAPPGAIGGFLRVTEQGEVINQKYGVRFIALRNLELITGATLAHSLEAQSAGLGTEEARIIATMAETARREYRGMVYDTPGFAAYHRAATPLDVIERLNIGSRPASRRSGEGIENLRAIPWVFSWAQTRVGFPGVFGFGTALEEAIESHGIECLRQLHTEYTFFQAMINDVEMVLAKSELGLGRRYSSLAGTGHEAFYDAISREFDLATRMILELKQIDDLLDDQRVLQRNIRLRNPYVDPLHLLQIDLLQRWRDDGRQDDRCLEALKATVKGIALGIQNTG